MKARTGVNCRTLVIVILVLTGSTLTLADGDHQELDNIIQDLNLNTSSTITERHDFPDYAEETTNVSEMLDNTKQADNACQIPVDPGPCTAELIRFFYDSTAKRCRQFIFGGCEGNINNFVTETDCLRTCSYTSPGDTRSQPFGENSHEFPTDISTSLGDQDQMLTLATSNGHGETSFTFSSEYPFIQLKAVDISEFKLRYIKQFNFFTITML